MSEFGFGLTNTTDDTQYYYSILNTYTNVDPTNQKYQYYQDFNNTARFEMGIRGLGLPTESFEVFNELVSIATYGQASCTEMMGGFCQLPQSCSSYPDLWQFDFKVTFLTYPDQYIRIPLATFATDSNIE
jgi:hypothetical protein